MIANETTIHKRSKDMDVSNCRKPSDLLQWEKPIPYSPLYKTRQDKYQIEFNLET